MEKHALAAEEEADIVAEAAAHLILHVVDHRPHDLPGKKGNGESLRPQIIYRQQRVTYLLLVAALNGIQ